MIPVYAKQQQLAMETSKQAVRGHLVQVAKSNVCQQFHAVCFFVQRISLAWHKLHPADRRLL